MPNESAAKLVAVWLFGLGAIFALYYLGNPFGIYDDIVAFAGLLLYSFKKVA